MAYNQLSSRKSRRFGGIQVLSAIVSGVFSHCSQSDNDFGNTIFLHTCSFQMFCTDTSCLLPRRQCKSSANAILARLEMSCCLCLKLCFLLLSFDVRLSSSPRMGLSRMHMQCGCLWHAHGLDVFHFQVTLSWRFSSVFSRRHCASQQSTET